MDYNSGHYRIHNTAENRYRLKAIINKEKAAKFFGIDIAKGEHNEFIPEKKAGKKVSGKKSISVIYNEESV